MSRYFRNEPIRVEHVNRYLFTYNSANSESLFWEWNQSSGVKSAKRYFRNELIGVITVNRYFRNEPIGVERVNHYFRNAAIEVTILSNYSGMRRSEANSRTAISGMNRSESKNVKRYFQSGPIQSMLEMFRITLK